MHFLESKSAIVFEGHLNTQLFPF